MTDVDIANLALGFLGDKATVANLNPPEGSAQAQHCARFYPLALRVILESHNWDNITTRTPLAILQRNYNGWAFAYAYPSDCAQLISVMPKSLYQDLFPDIDFSSARGLDSMWRRGWFPFELTGTWRDFRVEMIGNQQVILSQVPAPIALYCGVNATPGGFSGGFSEALAHLLASYLAGPILKGGVGAAEAKNQYALYKATRSSAVVQDSNQQHETLEAMPSWIRARGIW